MIQKNKIALGVLGDRWYSPSWEIFDYFLLIAEFSTEE
ncbi:hypothetical protein C789_456 [Microcystis aeruginosa FACHB-905 = DIANCHI905]|uniref:Uncharacterized protein n=1 Tax=Microcystis aeruginosa PCC 7806SL TaxID=1903187 RepID=A0AB33BJR6_MICA7|nr:hypothetical protein BH695_1648 [Microcystis aeruginosa PCC 7806SL]ELS49737.1 hypothetical protein C789_456 [Microcystis aeruginosa FACHB-905 = DIANCHI905]